MVAEQGCTFNDPSSCANSRGGLFDFNSSSSWQDLQIWNLVGESNLGYTQNSDVGEYGYDSLGLEVEGSGGVTLDHQVVAALATKDFYLGNLGLAARPINFDNQSDPQTGFLQSLKAKNKIPSVSYGYTAGASYRESIHPDRITIVLTLTIRFKYHGKFDSRRIRCLEIHPKQCRVYVRTRRDSRSGRRRSGHYLLGLENLWNLITPYLAPKFH